MGNLALWSEGSRALGSSIAYGNYPSRIQDGIRDFEGDSNADLAWSSASERLPQWAAIVFPRPARLNRIAVYWGRAGGYSTPARFEVQCWIDGAWKAVAPVVRPDPERITEAAFDPVACEAVRIWQAAGDGPASSPDRMHVAELEAHGAFLPGPDVNYARIRDALREEWERNFHALREPITTKALARIDRSRKKRPGMGPIGAAEMARARCNAASTKWGKSLSDKILADANWWLDRDDEFICGMIPAENPRAISPSYERGCPIHGGGRKCMRTNTALPYRWQCIEGGEWWYDGARVRNPSTGAWVEVRDHGDGWTAPPGFANPGTTYHFHAAWRYYVLSKLFYHPYELTIPSPDAYTGDTAITRLTHAYALTGDVRYAHKAGVMLNRLAEVYRHYNGTVDEQRPLTRGYLVQVSWEEWPIHDCLAAYDLLRDVLLADRSLLDFFRGRGDCDYNGDGEVDSDDIRYNIEHNLFGFMYEWLHRAMAIQTGDYIVREGLVLAAMGAMLGNDELVQEAIDGPYGLALNLTNNSFRDGKWWYDSPGYSVGTTEMLLERLFSLKGLNLFEDPRLRIREAVDFVRNVDCDGRLPNIGDTGGADSRLRVLNPRRPCATEDIAWIHTGEAEYLRRPLSLSEGDMDRIREGYADWRFLFHADPVRQPVGFYAPKSVVFHDSGFAILRTGEDPASRRHLVFNYGKGNAGHGHRDKLSVQFMACGYDLSADLGYPTTFTHRKVFGWETHTASHATVCVDNVNQELATGSLRFAGRTAGTQVICASGEKAYPGLARTYERTLALVDGPGTGAYAFDVFRVQGGEQHDYLFRSLSGDRGEGFRLDLPGGSIPVAQTSGTMAGEEVEFGERPGLGYIRDVSRAACDGDWTATWRVGDAEGTGIRLSMIGCGGREILTGRGEGHGFFGKSPWDACVAVRNRPGGGESLFAGVLEPFQGEPGIRSVRPFEVSGGVGVRVALPDREDWLLLRIGDRGTCRSKVAGRDLEFTGRLARITVHSGGRAEVHLVQGTALDWGGSLLQPGALPRGSVQEVDPGTSTAVLRLEEGDSIEEGDLLVFRNPAYHCTSSYEVKCAKALGDNRYRIVLNMSLVLSEGVVQRVREAEGAFETDTCLTKLKVCPGLFDGKAVYVKGVRRGALTEANPPRFAFADRGAIAGVAPSDRFTVCDLDPGDAFEAMRSAHRVVDSTESTRGRR